MVCRHALNNVDALAAEGVLVTIMIQRVNQNNGYLMLLVVTRAVDLFVPRIVVLLVIRAAELLVPQIVALLVPRTIVLIVLSAI